MASATIIARGGNALAAGRKASTATDNAHRFMGNGKLQKTIRKTETWLLQASICTQLCTRFLLMTMVLGTSQYMVPVAVYVYVGRSLPVDSREATVYMYWYCTGSGKTFWHQVGSYLLGEELPIAVGAPIHILEVHITCICLYTLH